MRIRWYDAGKRWKFRQMVRSPLRRRRMSLGISHFGLGFASLLSSNACLMLSRPNLVMRPEVINRRTRSRFMAERRLVGRRGEERWAERSAAIGLRRAWAPPA